jgi:SAM-dependent methyltransferase
MSRGPPELSREDDLSFLTPPGEVADWRMVAVFDAAAEVGLFEELPASPIEAAARLGLDERAVRILLDALSVWGIVEELDGSYSMSPGWPPDRGEAATLRQHAQVLRTWSTQLGDRLRGTSPSPFEMPPERRRLWLEALAARAREQAPLVVEACLRRFPDARRVLDLGGGHGEHARAFGQRGLSVVLQDLEPTIELLKSSDLPHSGVELFAGDFFETLPATRFDLVLCAGVTHIYDSTHNRLLYRRLASTIAPGGGLAIVTFLPERDPRASIFAVQMLAVSTGGNAHKENDYCEWLRAEGYREPEIQSLGDSPNFLLLAPR